MRGGRQPPCHQRSQAIAERPGETEQNTDALPGPEPGRVAAENDDADQADEDAHHAARLQCFRPAAIITITVNRGVVAFRIEASPLGT